MRHAICYVSNKKKEISDTQIEELLEECSTKNSLSGIKGLLLYSEGNFFQIIEGEKVFILNLFEIIKKDPRHYGVIQIIGRDIEQDAFDGYKTDILTDKIRCQSKLPKEYTDTLEGLPFELKRIMERMMETFIDTH
ncbi:BLUF domain-containing protein [Salegentibacter sp. JZCK2]|uniref:BLUF domain-containing protein n=1 Tax=Salegentibacter tibetensis TaxID=2873600 RepID=UPI001CCEF1CE|nr:BLUF domain-containing protein [Salegentibacter tibetensis]MBZ9730376.1 BLUF domain-containing protein [Salegentibacter tibetensis]